MATDCMARSTLLRPSDLCSLVKNCMAVINFLRTHKACCKEQNFTLNNGYKLDIAISAMMKIGMAGRNLLRSHDVY